jgi:hypothetical protein
MDKPTFITYLHNGGLATQAVRLVTGQDTEIVTLASLDEEDSYVRYGIMMAGSTMAALIVLQLQPQLVGAEYMTRIKAGEPVGAVVPGMMRKGAVEEFPQAVRASASLWREGILIGYVEEIFTASLFPQAAQQETTAAECTGDNHGDYPKHPEINTDAIQARLDEAIEARLDEGPAHYMVSEVLAPTEVTCKCGETFTGDDPLAAIQSHIDEYLIESELDKET